MVPKKKSADTVLPKIFTIRKLKVVRDAKLARLYGVPTMRLNEAVKRNTARFPLEFSFVLTREENAGLISQIAISNEGRNDDSGSQIAILKNRRGGTRKPARVFTEHGALMAATVLRSEKAVQMSLYLVRAFVAMREQLTSNLAVLRRLAEIDKKLIEHDVVLSEVVKHLQPLLSPPPEKKKPKIGFHRGNR